MDWLREHREIGLGCMAKDESYNHHPETAERRIKITGSGSTTCIPAAPSLNAPMHFADEPLKGPGRRNTGTTGALGKQ